MTRQPIDVRRAGSGEVEDLLELWSMAREDLGPSARPFAGTGPDQVRPRLQAALRGDDVQLVLARWEGRPAGYVLLRLAPVAALVDGLALHIEHLFVVPELRRHGVARALLTAVTGIAERAGAEQIVSSAPPGARDTHRFLARLGFSPVVVRRVAATSVLRRKLAGEAHRGGLQDLLSRRRSLRARAGRLRRPEPFGTADPPVVPAVVRFGGATPIPHPAQVLGTAPVLRAAPVPGTAGALATAQVLGVVRAGEAVLRAEGPAVEGAVDGAVSAVAEPPREVPQAGSASVDVGVPAGHQVVAGTGGPT